MLRIVFALVALLASFAGVAGEATQVPASARPVAVLLITDPWAMVIGADTPWFALYDDGRVIFVEKNTAGAYAHMTARLSPAQLADVEATLRAFIAEPVPKKIDLRPNWTDQPTSHLFLDVDGRKLVTAVHGLGHATAGVAWRHAGETQPDVLPANIAGLHRYLADFHVASATKWIPDRLEVMFWDYNYAPGASIVWPASWPGLEDPTTLKRGDDYSIFLPGTQEPALIAFLATRKKKGAIALGGRKWAVDYRPVFPQWRDAFREP
ncbi:MULTISPECIES: hypothetical protein [Xanthomonas]|uniref:hypothetical protein n=1 Tax=Xanthomonas TaxID=338 RepID=UPI001ADBB48C|nr:MULTISPECIES: hypothetical protein [unclassified Xanthomonas]MBO9872753.1 hypothetical protein [Xanthomonas sp. D-93]WNH45022.1 hypothetical protein PG878_00640 [Xanthomonas sp. A6251]